METGGNGCIRRGKKGVEEGVNGEKLVQKGGSGWLRVYKGA